MTDSSPVHFDLRFRPREVPADPPDIGAFLHSARREADSPIPRPTAIGLAPGSVSPAREASAPLVVFFEHAVFAIPSFRAASAALPDLDAWSLRPTRFGWLAAVPRARGRVSGMRTAWIVAACLPLSLAPTLAHADAPAKPQTPAKSGTSAGAEIQASPDASKKTIAPELPAFPGERTTDPEPPTDVQTDPSTSPASTEAVCPEPIVAIPEWMLEGRPVSVVDAAWEGVIGYDVELELKGGREIDGRVTAVQPDTFTLIHRGTGVVRVLQKSSVARLRVAIPAALPSRDGMGLLVGGGLLTAIGAPVFLSGAVFLGVCPSCAFLHIPLLITGAGALGGGIPMIVGGTRRRRAYNEAREQRWSAGPHASLGRHGWSGGLRLRF